MKIKLIFVLAIILVGFSFWEPPRKSASNNATISWSGPADGNLLSSENMAGCRLYWGYSPGLYTTVIDMGKKTQYTFLNFAHEKYVAVKCYDIYGNESEFSDEKMITRQWNRIKLN
jgi:hypothetical protein